MFPLTCLQPTLSWISYLQRNRFFRIFEASFIRCTILGIFWSKFIAAFFGVGMGLMPYLVRPILLRSRCRLVRWFCDGCKSKDTLKMPMGLFAMWTVDQSTGAYVVTSP